ncbi:hypothetical protein Hanom_Chr04g00288001 [Helianthus anomalus]
MLTYVLKHLYTDSNVVVLATIDILQITLIVVASVGSTRGINNDVATSMMQMFWDFAIAAPPADDDSEAR